MRMSSPKGSLGSIVRITVAAMIVASVLGPSPAAAGTIVALGAPLPLATPIRVHPDAALSLLVPSTFNVYAGATMPPEYQSVATLAGVPTGGTMDVVIYSEVWRHDDGHLLFAYKVENNSTTDVRRANLVGYGPEICDIIDCGVLDLGGDAAFDQGEVLELQLSNGDRNQLAFIFEAMDDEGGMVTRMIQPGQTSQWFYAETDATAYTSSVATVQDSGRSADGIGVLVPAPEPATLALMGAGVLLMRLVRRRTV